MRRQSLLPLGMLVALAAMIPAAAAGAEIVLPEAPSELNDFTVVEDPNTEQYANWVPSTGATDLGTASAVDPEELPDVATWDDSNDWTPQLIDLSVATSDVIVTRCAVRFHTASANPDPPASGKRWAIARTFPDYMTQQQEAALQAEVSHAGDTNATFTTPTAKAQWGFGLRWPATAPRDSWVVAKVRPMWDGGIAARSYYTSMGNSMAKGVFAAKHAWYNRSLSSYEGTKTMFRAALTVTDGTLKKKYFENLDSTKAKDTFGIDLTRGQKYTYYDYAVAWAQVTTEFGAPAVAAVDVGSKTFDTPANMNQNGESIQGTYFAGTDAFSDTFILEFHVPGKRISCPT